MFLFWREPLREPTEHENVSPVKTIQDNSSGLYICNFLFVCFFTLEVALFKGREHFVNFTDFFFSFFKQRKV